MPGGRLTSTISKASAATPDSRPIASRNWPTSCSPTSWRRVDGTGVTATVLHPGVVRTGFAAEDPPPMWKVFLPLIRPFLKTPKKGAATSIYLASSPEVEGVTGKYFADSKPKTSGPSSYDTAAAARLWQISVDLVGRTAGV